MQKQNNNRYPIFNKQYNIIKSLGEGHTSKVYLCQCIFDPSVRFAIKILKEEFLLREKDSLKSFENEINIL
jgi:hypothetical protein